MDIKIDVVGNAGVKLDSISNKGKKTSDQLKETSKSGDFKALDSVLTAVASSSKALDTQTRKLSNSTQRQTKIVRKRLSESSKLKTTTDKLTESTDKLTSTTDKNSSVTQRKNTITRNSTKVAYKLGNAMSDLSNVTDRLSTVNTNLKRTKSRLLAVTKDSIKTTNKNKEAIKRTTDATEKYSNTVKTLPQHNTHATAQIIGFTALIATLKTTINAFSTLEQKELDIAKTTGLSGEKLKDFTGTLDDLARNVKGLKLDALYDISAIAGQLGIKGKQNLLDFTVEIQKLAKTSTLTAEQAGEGFAQLSNSLGEPIKNIRNLTSTFTALASATTASESVLLDYTQRLAGAGKTLGLTTSQIVGIGATLKDVGISAEVGGTAISDVFLKIVSNGDKMASRLGLDMVKFAKSVNTEPVKAVYSLLDALGKLDKKAKVQALKDLKLTGSGLSSTLLKLSSNTRKLAQNLEVAREGYIDANATQREFDIVTQGLASHQEQFNDKLKLFSAELGEVLAPTLKAILSNLGSLLGMLQGNGQAIISVTGYVVTLGVAFKGLNIIMNASPFGRIVAGLTAIVSASMLATKAIRNVFETESRRRRLADEYRVKVASTDYKAELRLKEKNKLLATRVNLEKQIAHLTPLVGTRGGIFEKALANVNKKLEETKGKLRGFSDIKIKPRVTIKVPVKKTVKDLQRALTIPVINIPKISIPKIKIPKSLSRANADARRRERQALANERRKARIVAKRLRDEARKAKEIARIKARALAKRLREEARKAKEIEREKARIIKERLRREEKAERERLAILTDFNQAYLVAMHDRFELERINLNKSYQKFKEAGVDPTQLSRWYDTTFKKIVKEEKKAYQDKLKAEKKRTEEVEKQLTKTQEFTNAILSSLSDGASTILNSFSKSGDIKSSVAQYSQSGALGDSLIASGNQTAQLVGVIGKVIGGALSSEYKGTFDNAIDSQSITNSLQILDQTQNKQLDYTRSIATNTKDMIHALGSFGKSVSLNGATEISSVGDFQTNSTFDSVINTLSLGLLGDGLTQALSSAIYSSQKELIKSGVRFYDTTIQALDGLEAQSFQLIKETKSYGFGLISSSKTRLQLGAKLDKTSEQQLGNVIQSGIDNILTSAKAIGIKNSKDLIKNYVISIGDLDFTGLTSDEVTKKVTDALSVQLDNITSLMGDSFIRFANSGEGQYETLIRVATKFEDASQSLKNAGISMTTTLNEIASSANIFDALIRGSIVNEATPAFVGIADIIKDFSGSGEKLIEVYRTLIAQQNSLVAITGDYSSRVNQELVSNFDSVDQFAQLQNNFFSGFLSDKDKLQSYQDQLRSVFGAGAIPKNLQDYVDLVREQNLETLEGSKRYADLLKNQDLFKKYITTYDKLAESTVNAGNKIKETITGIFDNISSSLDATINGLYLNIGRGGDKSSLIANLTKYNASKDALNLAVANRNEAGVQRALDNIKTFSSSISSNNSAYTTSLYNDLSSLQQSYKQDIQKVEVVNSKSDELISNMLEVLDGDYDINSKNMVVLEQILVELVNQREAKISDNVKA